MKKYYINIFFIILFLLFLSPLKADVEQLLIPQTDRIYLDLYIFSKAGLIKSVVPEHFKYNAISTYEAANYIAEAAENFNNMKKTTNGDSQKYYEYAKQLREYAIKFYNKLVEMKKDVKKIEENLKSPELKEFSDIIDNASIEIFEIEQEYNKTTYRGTPPFKVQGMLNVRWQDVESFGVSPAHHTSLGGTFLSLWTEGVVTDDISFKLNITFERPANEAEKGDLPEYWGTGQRFLDKYTINLKAYGWMINTGFFWEDITPFIAQAILSERPALFERDPYALEETTKGHYENAFLHAFVKRGDIWSKHGFMGIGIYNLDLLGARFKVMAGKAEQFDERYDKLFLYEYAGRLTYPLNIPVFYDTEISANFFNTSNERAEIETLAPDAPSDNFPVKPDGYIQAQTIFGGDLKTNILNLLKIKGEFAQSDYHSYLPKPFSRYPNYYPPRVNQKGNAFYVKGGFTLLPVEVKFTQIDADYVARASAVNDTARRVTNSAGEVDIHYDSYAGDPTLYYNNLRKIDLFVNLEIPGNYGFVNFNFGTASQLKPTSNRVFVDHFLFGNRLTFPVWWHLFFSQYGYPVSARDRGFYNYNDSRHPAVDNAGLGNRYIFTEKWLTNKEMIVLSGKPDETSVKYINNASLEFKILLNKIFGLQNNLFLDLYGELVTLTPGADLNVTFDPKMLFSQNLMSAFIVYNLTRKINIMAEACIERWTTEKSVRLKLDANEPDDPRPIDYIDNSYGIGLDYDFAPRTALFLRVKKFYHNDLVYKTQNFDGTILFMEIKNFF